MSLACALSPPSQGQLHFNFFLRSNLSQKKTYTLKVIKNWFDEVLFLVFCFFNMIIIISYKCPFSKINVGLWKQRFW